MRSQPRSQRRAPSSRPSSHIHELLRQYAEEQLELAPGTAQSTREAHAAFFASFMEQRWPRLHDHRAATALREIKDDIENVRAALRVSVQRRDGKQLVKFFASLWLAYETWGWFGPAIELVREAGSGFTGAQSDRDWELAHAQALAVEGWFMSLIGAPDAGLPMALTSQESLKRLGGDLFLSTSSVNICAIFLNRLEELETSTPGLMEQARRTGDPFDRGFALVWSAFLLVSRGQFDEAEAQATEAVATFERLQSPFGIAVASGIVSGAIYMMRGQLERARHSYEKGLRAAAVIGYRRVVQLAHDSLGTIALLEGRIDEAYAIFVTSLRITFEDGQPREQLGSLRDVATIYVKRGELEKAVELLAVVLAHPANVQNSLSRRESLRSECERLLGEIRSRLSADRYEGALRRGESLQLGSVVDELLKT